MRIVVTGLGAVSPYGIGVKALWNGLSTGTNGIGVVKDFDTSDLCCSVGAAVPPFDPGSYLERRLLVGMDIFEIIGLIAAREAVEDSGYPVQKDTSFRLGVIGGSAIGGKNTMLDEMEKFHKRDGGLRVGVFTVPRIEIDMLAGWAALLLGFRGPNFSINAACASGNYALGMAASLIRGGDVDAMLVIGADKGVTRLGFSGFCSMRAMAKMDKDDPRKSLKAFDIRRTGTLLGDGGAALLVESEESAIRRSAHIYGEIGGVGMTDDAYNLSAPDPEATSIVKAMGDAISRAGLTPAEIEYINAHGTGTPHNDISETRAIKRLFGEQAYRVPVSSIKSMVAHQLGASSAIEAIASLLAIRDGIIPPTINLETPDPECDLDYVPNHPRTKQVRTVLSNSFGFGGHNACVVFKKYS